MESCCECPEMDGAIPYTDSELKNLSELDTEIESGSDASSHPDPDDEDTVDTPSDTNQPAASFALGSDGDNDGDEVVESETADDDDEAPMDPCSNPDSILLRPHISNLNVTESDVECSNNDQVDVDESFDSEVNIFEKFRMVSDDQVSSPAVQQVVAPSPSADIDCGIGDVTIATIEPEVDNQVEEREEEVEDEQEMTVSEAEVVDECITTEDDVPKKVDDDLMDGEMGVAASTVAELDDADMKMTPPPDSEMVPEPGVDEQIEGLKADVSLTLDGSGGEDDDEPNEGADSTESVSEAESTDTATVASAKPTTPTPIFAKKRGSLNAALSNILRLNQIQSTSAKSKENDEPINTPLIATPPAAATVTVVATATAAPKSSAKLESSIQLLLNSQKHSVEIGGTASSTAPINFASTRSTQSRNADFAMTNAINRPISSQFVTSRGVQPSVRIDTPPSYSATMASRGPPNSTFNRPAVVSTYHPPRVASVPYARPLAQPQSHSQQQFNSLKAPPRLMDNGHAGSVSVSLQRPSPIAVARPHNGPSIPPMLSAAASSTAKVHGQFRSVEHSRSLTPNLASNNVTTTTSATLEDKTVYRFTPPDAKLGIKIPAAGYPCQECKSAFALKSSLEFHLQRRSVRMTAYCTVCHKQCLFYNKCTFLAHLRTHSTQSLNAFKNVVSQPISLLEFSQWFDSDSFVRCTDQQKLWKYEKLDDDAPSRPVPKIDELDVKTEMASSQGGVVVTSTNNLASVQVQTCTECKESCDTPAALRAHFAYNLSASQKQFICTQCQAVYFSRCSFSAHLRSHTSKAPCVCAECGYETTDGTSLGQHTLIHKTTPTALDAWRCEKCHTFYSAWDALVMHVAGQHCDTFVKCTQCPMAFRTMKAYEDHRANTHSAAQGGEDPPPPGKQIFKCYHCEMAKYFQQKDHLLEHIRVHLRLVKPFQVFRCAMCGRLMENKTGLLSHFRSFHRLNVRLEEIHEELIKVGPNGKALISETVPSVPQPPHGQKRPAPPISQPTTGDVMGGPPPPKQSFPQAISTTALPKRGRYLCHLCRNNVHCRTEASYALHMKMFHQVLVDTTPQTTAVSSLSCRKCQRTCNTIQELFNDGLEHIRRSGGERGVVCLLCDNLPLETGDALGYHLAQHISTLTAQRSQYHCFRHCDKTFADTAQAYNHIREIHRLPSMKCDGCDKLMSSVKDLNSHLGRGLCPGGVKLNSMKTVAKFAAAASSAPTNGMSNPLGSMGLPSMVGLGNSSVSVLSAGMLDSEGLGSITDTSGSGTVPPHSSVSYWSCAKCQFRTSLRKSFTDHVVNNHREPRHFQCLECGLCFVTDISLFRHLRAAHHIVKGHSYLSQHKLARPLQGSGSGTEMSQYLANGLRYECDVCRRIFESQNALNAHMKTHGLRYIQAKRSGITPPNSMVPLISATSNISSELENEKLFFQNAML